MFLFQTSFQGINDQIDNFQKNDENGLEAGKSGLVNMLRISDDGPRNVLFKFPYNIILRILCRLRIRGL